ncbi:hypothetical protein [Paenibacillus odorifer]|uniref:hypothetical protein n=1 Tax=Paenibacillus odorifer TaxID=189426 RepID=UPI00117F187F|nr:hypothetical protein [Paenibacillus odorifer]
MSSYSSQLVWRTQQTPFAHFVAWEWSLGLSSRYLPIYRHWSKVSDTSAAIGVENADNWCFLHQ